MADRSHLSIGEVLSLLRDEFPDVTISKIRFLESQGLVDPERTPSGYRKFYDHDVDRLSWILRQQREHFLPLKVIRGRLSAQEKDDAGEEPIAVGATGYQQGSESNAPTPNTPTAGGSRPPGHLPSLFADLHAASGAAPAGEATGPDGLSARRNGGAVPATGPGGVGFGSGTADPAASGPVAAGTSRSAPAPAAPTSAASTAGLVAAVLRGGPGEDSDTYTAEEIAAAVGGDPALVSELVQFGLITSHAVVGGNAYYDETAVAVARAAVSFSNHGVEVRHLKVWRNAAEREADLFQQVVLPLLRQRNPQARQQAAETLGELAAAGADLRAALVERAARQIR